MSAVMGEQVFEDDSKAPCTMDLNHRCEDDGVESSEASPVTCLQATHTNPSTESQVTSHHFPQDDSGYIKAGEKSSAVFMIDRSTIQEIKAEEQPSELQTLSVEVYDQEVLEQGILQQVDRAVEQQRQQLEEKKLKQNLKLVSDAIRRCQGELKCKKELLKVSTAGDGRTLSLKKDIEQYSARLSILNDQHSSLLSGSGTFTTSNEVYSADNKLWQSSSREETDTAKFVIVGGEENHEESERECRIRLGEMTPFGNLLGSSENKKDVGSYGSLEKYLQNQADLQTKCKKKTKLSSKSLQSVNNSKWKEDESRNFETSHADISKKVQLKKSNLSPRKRKWKERLGSTISEDQRDQHRNPGRLLSEVTLLDSDDHDDTGSEYLPSDEELSKSFEEERSSSKKKLPAKCKKSVSRKLASNSEGWATDDSDWDYSDDESKARKRRRSKKEIDDGNVEDYQERIKLWEREKAESADAETETYHTFDGEFKVPNNIWNKLYKYQKVGVQWLWELNQQRCGGILGDEMGLGKTVQVIAFLAGLSCSRLLSKHGRYRGLGPTLIVCPTTVMHQWVQEFHIWWPPFRVAILHDSGSFSGKRVSLIHQVQSSGGLLVTSYTGVVQLRDVLVTKQWHYVILDEGHKIRNPDAQVTLAVKQMRTPHRIILSGSPMQNNLKELWSLFDFIFPGKLGTLPVFLAHVAVPITQGGYANASEVQVATAYKCATVLRDSIAPYLLRRVKADVKQHINLPAKSEQVLFCGLTDEQRRYYKAYLDSGVLDQIVQGCVKVFVGLINLRKICNHPDLYSGGPKLFRGDREEDLPEQQRYGHWSKAGKMLVVQRLLNIWQKQGHRVLLFTQSRKMLLILERFVQNEGYSYLKLDGTTSIGSRQPLITKFNQDATYFIFLLTTRVGGLGVNLTGADRVVIYDPDWNPATDTQARERAWRIGQQNSVTVYRLVTAGTIEEKIYHRQIFKQFLTNRVLHDPKQQRFFKANDLFELFTLKESDKDGSTETAAIFAGTGSEVKLNFRQKASHSRAKKKTRVTARNKCKGPVSSFEDNSPIPFTQSKLEYMRQLAQHLSKKISSQVVEKSVTESHSSCVPGFIPDFVHSSETSSTTCSTPNSRNIAIGEYTEEITKTIGKPVVCVEKPNDKISTPSEFHEHDQHSENIVEKSSPSHDKHGTCDTSTASNQGPTCSFQFSPHNPLAQTSCIKSSQGNLITSTKIQNCVDQTNIDKVANEQSKLNMTNTVSGAVGVLQSVKEKHSFNVGLEHGKTSGFPIKSCKTGKSTKHYMQPKQHKQHINLGLAGVSSKDVRKSQKKEQSRKKRREKNSMFEGEPVPYLVKQRTAKGCPASDEETQKEQDDYVLRKLFKKSGLQTALHHDTIMGTRDADYALVEGEAQKVAREAVKALKESRRNCWHADSGVPSWTGQSGALRSSNLSRPRFGNKKCLKPNHTAVSPALDKHEDPQPSSSKTADSLDKELGTTLCAGVADTPMSSRELLSRMRVRNRLLATSEPLEGVATPVMSDVPTEHTELLADMRNFVALEASVEGRCTTKEIIDTFKDRLPPGSSPLFKFLLQEICEFHRMPSGEGMWKLRTEFKW